MKRACSAKSAFSSASTCKRLLVLLPALLLQLAVPLAASAAPRLRCHLDQGGQSQVLEFSPVADPYAVRAIDINGSFRFKAVVIGDERRVEYIKLYIYYQTKRQPVLLHAAKYLLPAVQPGASADALTGMNYLYSPLLGRELQYGCALVEVAP